MINATQHRSNAQSNREQMYEVIVGRDCNVELVAKRLLTTLGFKSKLMGTQYLKDAIVYRYNNAHVICVGMTNRTYIAVAKMHNTTSTRVERAIRNAIITCFSEGALKSFNTLAQAKIIHDDYAPSNGEFLCSVVNWLQLEVSSGNIKHKPTTLEAIDN